MVTTSPSPQRTPSTELFAQQCAKSQTLFEEKNKAYGDTIWKTGVLGACVELIGAVARLPIMVVRNPTHGRDVKAKLIDVLRDILNYAAIALMMVEHDNWEGEL